MSADLAGIEIGRNVPMRSYTTLGIGGGADFLVKPRDANGLREAFAFCGAYGLPLNVIGKGSKLLVRDGGVRGVTAVMTRMNGISVNGTVVTVAGGAGLMRLSAVCAAAGLSGLEWAVGIPASLGGAVFMNAGAYGGSMADCVRSVTVFDGGGFLEIPARECDFGYRASVFNG
ncbi:MAG: FAD-binding protein, partial [Clostridiales bacterium]|nr:FAD-binding protein [Clostridiales bacterium]